jgi:hypothetical protein
MNVLFLTVFFIWLIEIQALNFLYSNFVDCKIYEQQLGLFVQQVCVKNQRSINSSGDWCELNPQNEQMNFIVTCSAFIISWLLPEFQELNSSSFFQDLTLSHLYVYLVLNILKALQEQVWFSWLVRKACLVEGPWFDPQWPHSLDPNSLTLIYAAVALITLKTKHWWREWVEGAPSASIYNC